MAGTTGLEPAASAVTEYPARDSRTSINGQQDGVVSIHAALKASVAIPAHLMPFLPCPATPLQLGLLCGGICGTEAALFKDA
jgi:hypothetical protein